MNLVENYSLMIIKAEKDIFYHDRYKGCKIKNALIKTPDIKHQFNCLRCNTHQVYCCNCGFEFGHHQFKAIKEIKDNCVSCGKKILKGWKSDKRYFEDYGNYCRHCLDRINDRIEHKNKKIDNEKNKPVENWQDLREMLKLYAKEMRLIEKIKKNINLK